MSSRRNNLPLLSSKELEVGYKLKGGKILTILSGLNLKICPGELITFIGPNGCGKSTLIRSLIGLLPKIKGAVYYKDKNISDISVSSRAQHIGVVLTDPVYERNMTVLEVVSLGRYPHTNWLGRLSVGDEQVVQNAIEKVGLVQKKHARLGELSDGERQRAMVARVLAQDVDLIILDEPTAHLDLPNRMDVLVLLKKLAHEFGKGVLLSTHELGLALQVSDRVWMVGKEKQLYDEIPEQLILSGLLDKTFGNKNITFHPWSASFEMVPNENKVAYVKGMGLLQACVVRLLKRHGFKVEYEEGENQLTFEVNEEKHEVAVSNGKITSFTKLEDLQAYLQSYTDLTN